MSRPLPAYATSSLPFSKSSRSDGSSFENTGFDLPLVVVVACVVAAGAASDCELGQSSYTTASSASENNATATVVLFLSSVPTFTLCRSRPHIGLGLHLQLHVSRTAPQLHAADHEEHLVAFDSVD